MKVEREDAAAAAREREAIKLKINEYCKRKFGGRWNEEARDILAYVQTRARFALLKERKAAQKAAAQGKTSALAQAAEGGEAAPSPAKPEKQITARDASEILRQQLLAKADFNILVATHFGPDGRELKEEELEAAIRAAEERAKASGVTDTDKEIQNILASAANLYKELSPEERERRARAYYAAGKKVESPPPMTSPTGPEIKRVVFDPAELAPFLNRLYQAEYDRRHTEGDALSTANAEYYYALQNLRSFYERHGMGKEQAEQWVRQEHEIPVQNNQNLDEIVAELRKPTKEKERRGVEIVNAPVVGSRDRMEDVKRKRLEDDLFNLMVEHYRLERRRKELEKKNIPVLQELVTQADAVMTAGEDAHKEFVAFLDGRGMPKEEIDRIIGDIVTRAEDTAALPPRDLAHGRSRDLATSGRQPADTRDRIDDEVNRRIAKETEFNKNLATVLEETRQFLQKRFSETIPDATAEAIDAAAAGVLLKITPEVERMLRERMEKK